MLARVMAGVCLALVISGQAMAREAPSAFDIDICLRVIRQAESGGLNSAIGDNGRARGAYQIQKPAWERYSRLPWYQYAHDPVQARAVAGCIVSDIVKYCKKHKLVEYNKNPYRIVCMYYNAGRSTRMTPDKWHQWTKNKVYKAL